MVRKNLLKNSACICLGILFISLSSLLMTQIYFQRQIDAQIQNISLLKDIRYPFWGKNPNPSSSIYTQTFALYQLKEIDNQIHSEQSNISKPYDYHYQYQNTSFAQGNSGRLNFINKWQLKQVSTFAPSISNIKSINLAADKIFNYDHYAPPQRKFVLFYNYMLKVIAGPFLEKFYTLYLHKFFFQQKQLVLQTVFKPLGIDVNKASGIYQHETFGWSNTKTFASWVKLSLKGQKYSIRTPQYQSFIKELNLTQREVSGLIFEKSTLYNMIFALNGTIKSKLMQTRGFGYKKCKQYCSNQQLAGFQIATGFLTGGDPLFASLGLNMSTKDLNSTFFDHIQYSRFCNDNKDQVDCTSQSNMAEFFTSHYLGDFQLMDILWNNQENTDLIEQKFHLQEGKGRSIVLYVMNLYNKFVKNYENQFSWAQNNYNNIQNSIMKYKNLFLVQLFSRAYYKKFIQNKQANCQEYFTNQFSQYQNAACQFQEAQSQSWNFILYESVLRNYIKAYFFIDSQRDRMAEQLSMPYEKIIQFFLNSQNSLFARQIQEIELIFKQKFSCINNDLSICSPQRLFCLQWGSNKILENLPVDIFSNKIKSINEWDTYNILNGFNPDYEVVIGQQKSVEQCMDILSSDSSDGIFSFFNLLKMARHADGNPQLQNRLKYVGKSVMQIYFGGVLQNHDVSRLFQGFSSEYITMKQQMQIAVGGAPWLQNRIKLIKTDNKAEIKNNQLQQTPQFDTIDTGIFHQNKTRQITKIWGETTSSSKYTVFHGTKQDDQGQQVPFDIFYKYVTDRKVEGTNLLGFHPFIQQNQQLKAYILQAHQAMNLKFDEQVKYQSSELNQLMSANKYEISNENMNSFIGIQELNQNYFSLSPQSYVIIEPITGLTLELKLIYTTRSNPLYTKFITQTKDPIDIYSSQIYYKRHGLQEIQQLKNDQDDKKLFTIISIVSIITSLLLTIIFTAIYYVYRRRYKTEKETLLQTEAQYGEV